MKIVNYNDMFFNNKLGIIVDDAYDIYKKYQYIKYVNENNVDLVYSQDYDISYLKHMPEVKYVIFNDHIENIEVLYELPNLLGIKLSSKYLKSIDIHKLNKLNSLMIVIDENIDLGKYSFLEKLCVYNYNFNDLMQINHFKNLVSLSIINSKSIKNIKGVPSSLEKFTIEYCLNLEDISNLSSLANLKELFIHDCNKIEKLECAISNLYNLESLIVFNKETKPKGFFDNLDFMFSFSKLKTFETDYKISDFNLKPLLNLKSVTILRWFTKYNVRDCNLPHEYVLYRNDNGIVERKLLKEILDGIHNSNIIWMDNIYYDK